MFRVHWWWICDFHVVFLWIRDVTLLVYVHTLVGRRTLYWMLQYLPSTCAIHIGATGLRQIEHAHPMVKGWWTTMIFELAMTSTSQPFVIGGLHVGVDDLEHSDPPHNTLILLWLCEREFGSFLVAHLFKRSAQNTMGIRGTSEWHLKLVVPLVRKPKWS